MDIQPQSTDFNWNNAFICASASKLVYQSGDVISRFMQQSWGYEETRFFDVKKTQGFIGRKDNTILICFRGTKGTGDWIANMKILKSRKDYGRVHSGFLKAYEAVQDIIIEEILTAPNESIFITGHSLGGAIATICAADIASRGRGNTINGIYTFGQPRTGNKSFKTFVNNNFTDQMFRFVFDDDIVPRIPPLFRHCEELHHFNKHGGLKKPERLSTDSAGGTEAVDTDSSNFNASEFEFSEIESDEDFNNAAFEADEDDIADIIESDEDAHPPLTPAEFEALRAEIKTLQVAVGYDGSIESDEDLDATIEGIIPSAADHSMVNYVNAIRRMSQLSEALNLNDALSAQPAAVFRSMAHHAERMEESVPEFAGSHGDNDFDTDEFAMESSSPADEDFAMDSDEDIAIAIESDEDDVIAVSASAEIEIPMLEMAALVRLISPDWDPPSSITVNSKIGMIASIKGPLGAIEKLQSDHNIISVEYSRDAGVADLGESVPFIQADVVHRPAISETGTDAIVGIVDMGIDILHEAFLDANGQTRILGIWHQNGRNGNSPHSKDARFSQKYGDLYTQAEIQALINQSDSRAVPKILRDRLGHGTHVASIAAGRAVGSLGSGMAPDAKIIVVIPHMTAEEGSALSIGYSSSHVDALHFLKIAALGGNIVSAERMPIAVNVSLGMNAGAHDGSSLLEAGFDSITGIGRDPGIAIIKSAGNEKGRRGHASLEPAAGIQTFEWTSKNKDRAKDYFEVWYKSLDEMEFTLIDPMGNRSDVVSSDNPSVNMMMGGNRCILALKPSHEDNGDSRLTILIYENLNAIQRDTWTLEVNGKIINSQGEKIDIWVERDNARAIEFDFSDHMKTLSIPGTANHVICVGATTKSDPLRLYNRSSHGPTRLNKRKPEICAPGDKIIAAKGGTSDHQATTVKSGTSMAAPHIAGLVALAFSKRAKNTSKRQLNSNQIKATLIRNVRVLNGHTSGFGFGIIDALKFMSKLP